MSRVYLQQVTVPQCRTSRSSSRPVKVPRHPCLLLITSSVQDNKKIAPRFPKTEVLYLINTLLCFIGARDANTRAPFFYLLLDQPKVSPRTFSCSLPLTFCFQPLFLYFPQGCLYIKQYLFHHFIF